MSKTLHVVFKTHLDVGFTDYAAAVKQLYFERYIPQALRVARELRDTPGSSTSTSSRRRGRR